MSLVFDLGFHNGDDTYYYLTKGYNVISIDANPKLIELGKQRFSSQIKSGQLILLDEAISDISSAKKVDFYIHPNKSDWSSCLLEMAESDGSKSNHIEVNSTNLHKLFDTYGVPYYLKVDIEGYDRLVAKQLYEYIIKYDNKPEFVSFEFSKKDYFDILSYLNISGYQRFQLINQINHDSRDIKINNRKFTFSEFSSGPFGEDLPKEKWLYLDEMLTRYIKYKELKQVDNIELGIGWLDIHART